MSLPTCQCVAGLSQQQQLASIYCALKEVAESGNGNSSSTASLSSSEFYDDFLTNSANVVGRVSPTGQVWAVTGGSTPGAVAEVAGGVLKLTAGDLTDTIYPYVTLDTHISVIGAEVQWVNNNPANFNLCGLTLLVCSNAENLGSQACFHLTTNQYGAALQWCPNGVFGGGVVSTNQSTFFQTAQVCTIQFECNKVEGTARFYGPGFSLELSGLSITEDLKEAIYEISSDGVSVQTYGQFTRVWANPPRPDILGQTSMQYNQVLQDASRGWFRSKAGTIASGFEGGFWTYDSSGLPSMILQLTTSNRGEVVLPRDGNGLTFVSGATGFAEYAPGGQISNFGTATFAGLRIGVDLFGTYNGLNTGVKGTFISIIQHGVATLVGGTVVVANVYVTANTRIYLTSQSDGGTPGSVRVSARSAGVSFTITSSSVLDTSVIGYLLIEP